MSSNETPIEVLRLTISRFPDLWAWMTRRYDFSPRYLRLFCTGQIDNAPRVATRAKLEQAAKFLLRLERRYPDAAEKEKAR